jgi:hypothetical protein
VGVNINMGPLLRKLSPATDPVAGNRGLGWTKGAPGYDATRRFYSMLVSSAECGSSGSFDHFDRGLNSGLFKARFTGMVDCRAAGEPTATATTRTSFNTEGNDD